MVPASYHEFFSGCANVAGALVGLLFVAISVSPEKLTGADATTAFQVRAAAAFSVLVNALVITLFALLPDTNLGTIALIAGVTGLGSTAGIVLIQRRESSLQGVRELVVPVVLLGLYTWQVLSALELLHKPGDADALENEAIVVVVCFLTGIARAWELLGGRRTGIVHAAISVKKAAAATPTGGGDQPERPSSADSLPD
ncbi:MAG TPA: hypothetical protein VG165_16225 [Solirubrobacteraceae bacterium]|nr:hypothetical protein [Solirubrobacteraceae bacterium]